MSTEAEVAQLSAPARRERVHSLIERANMIVDEAIDLYGEGHRIVGQVVLFSGGDDSTVLAHLMRPRATAAAHANTTVGIEETREFVRATCAEWGLPLIEKVAPISYRDLVLEQGFPGPAQHFKMYQRLKERALRQVRAELVKHPRQERVVFMAGRRRDESRRREAVPLLERVRSVIWASPLAEWTKLDLNTYRALMGDVPRNRVSAILHMSGECLCGSFARAGELAEVEAWFPADAAAIRALEAELADRDDIPIERRTYGWGAYRTLKPSRSGPLCSSCEVPT